MHQAELVKHLSYLVVTSRSLIATLSWSLSLSKKKLLDRVLSQIEIFPDTRENLMEYILRLLRFWSRSRTMAMSSREPRGSNFTKKTAYWALRAPSVLQGRYKEY